GGRFAAVSPAGELEPTPAQPGTPPVASPAVIRLGSVVEPGGSPESDADLSRRNVRLGAIVVAVVVGVVGLGLLRSSKSGEPRIDGALLASLEQGGCTADTRADEGRAHVAAPTYSVNPPSGGDHDPVPSAAGFYDMTTVPADGHLVHSLEHGFVVVWYKPAEVSGTTLDGLRDLVRRRRWVLAVPRPSLPTLLAATAWHRRLLCPQDIGVQGPIDNFVRAFRDMGPEQGFV
ncbi:MAG TPA: DUF3105 domain-containing protein, partial [Acidimicrobiia bacterium]|nr:DUF3105 domain-containing protein [Acidimicrobiia bacterium]